MTFEIKKVITENDIVTETVTSNAMVKSSNMSKNYQDIEGEKSSVEGFICKNLYIAKIEQESSGTLDIKRFL